MEPTLSGKESRSPVFAQGGEPSRVLVAHPCWWEDEVATCRQGRDPQRASLLFTQLQKVLESTQTACSSMVGQHQTPRSRTGSAGMHSGFRKLTAKAKPRIPCTSGTIIRSGFPRTFAEHGFFIYIYISLETPSQGMGGILAQCRLPIFPKPNSKSEQESPIPHVSSSKARKVPYFSNVGF